MYEKIIKNPTPDSIMDIFNHKKIQIPPYQRFFAWKEDLISQLLEDIHECIKRQKNLFLGTIIVKEKNDNEEIIIDGQQRILTLIILLRQIKETGKLKRENEDELQEMFNTTRIKRIEINLNEKNRNEYFNKRIIQGDSNFNISSKYEDIIQPIINAEQIIKNNLKNKKKNQINKLYSFITKEIKILRIVLNKTAEESDIFESINAKRTELNDADLVKNYLLSKLPEKKQKEGLKIWQDIYDSFKQENKLVEFLGDFCYATASKKEDFAGKKDYGIYKFFKKRNKTGMYELKLLQKTHEQYELIKKPDYTRTSKIMKRINISLDCLNFLGFNSHTPLLLKAIRITNKRDSKEFLELLELVEVIQFIEQKATKEKLPQSVKDLFFKELYRIHDKNSLKKSIKKLREDFQELKVQNQEIMKELFAPIKSSGKNDKKTLTYVLYKIFIQKGNNSLANHRIADMDRTLEHVFPETLNKQKEPNPDEKWKKIMLNDLNEDINLKERTTDLSNQQKIKFYYKSVINSLGNVTLLSQATNSELGKKEFVKKKKTLQQKESNNILVKSIIDKRTSKWSVNEIRERNKKTISQYFSLFSNIRK